MVARRILASAGIFAFGISLMLAGCAKKAANIEPLPEPATRLKADASVAQPRAFDTSSEISFQEADLNEQLRREAAEKLKPVYFDFNSFSLRADAIERLGIIAGFCKDHGNLRILVQGHCDERGSSEYNIGLGERRARAARDYLANYGISPAQVEVTSYGKEQPAIAGCGDESCHQQNRRDEFKAVQ
jgi:peptidoglycan-associated lipoprotein